jgi:hypothetical protein
VQHRILYRDIEHFGSDKEYDVAKKYFPCTRSRMDVCSGDIVICRYSALPFFRELENDVESIGASLINTYRQHRYAADVGNWSRDLTDVTPYTWFRLEDLPEKGPFVLKGETNSRKFEWDTMMYAEDKRAAIEVHSRLCNDGLIGAQNIVIRQYIPLKTHLVGLRGLPITEEYRFFICNNEILCGGFYWSNYADDIFDKPNIDNVPKDFLEKVIKQIGKNIIFYALDVAQTKAGDWIVIEINDGMMSGLSEIPCDLFYSQLQKATISKTYMR